MSQLAIWLMVAALGQAPDASGLLDAVPAEADVVVRIRGIEAVHDDLVAMLKAMSPALGEQATPALGQMVAQVRTVLGDGAATQPFLVLLRAVKPDDPSAPPIAVIVKAAQLDAILKGVSGGKAPALKKEEGGLDSFDGPTGSAWFVARGASAVAIGPDKTLVARFAKPGDTALAKTLSPALLKEFQAGDLGFYVNLKALTARYGAEIAQAKQGFFGALDQAGKQGNNAAMMEMAKSMYGGLFDSIKEADALAFHLDFSTDGLAAGGDLTVKADSAMAKRIAGARSGDGAAMARLPADASFFVSMNLDAKTFEAFQKMGMGMMSAGGKPTPELEAAMASQRAVGRVEMASAMTIANGMRTFNLMTVADPKAFLASNVAMMNALKGSDSPVNVYKDVTVTPEAETYSGFTFTRVEMTIDPDKLAKLTAGNPASAGAMKAMFGGDKITSWYGVNATQMLQIVAPSWDAAKTQIDSYFKGSGNTLGDTPGFRPVRSKLADQSNVLFLMSVQGLLRQMAAQFSTKVPDDLPKDPAFIGASLTTTPPTGFEFRLVVPSAVGPVFEKGLVPMIQHAQPPPKQ